MSTLSAGTFAPRSIMVCTVSFQSSRFLCALVRFVSLWQAWPFSIAIAFPSPSGNSTTALAGAGVLGTAASGDGAGVAGAGACAFGPGAASLGPKYLVRYAARTSILSSGMLAPRSIMVWIVSFQSSRFLCAFVKLVSRWHIWQYSVAMGLPSPSGNSTGFGAGGAAAGGGGGGACPAF